MPAKNKRTVLGWMGLAMRGLGLLLLALGVGLVVWQQVNLSQDARRRPAAREFAIVEGLRMHFVCTGEGPRTFVLDSGLGGWSVFWWRVQPVLAQHGRVCAIDRPGYGWSDSTDAAHDGVSAARRLHEMLPAMGIRSPFVYVGHSLGANIGEIYAERYPGEVAALVLVEPGMPKDLLEDTNISRAQAIAAPECDWKCWAAYGAGHLGVLRFVGTGKSMGPYAESYKIGVSRPSYPVTLAREFAAVPLTAYEDLDVKGFGDIPVLTFGSTIRREPEGAETQADVTAWYVVQRAYLSALAARSPNGRGVVLVPNSTHATMVLGSGQSDFLTREILDFVEGAPAVSR
jgi:pimeloyl-ACP methyl ester carboxylesterase